MEMCRLTTKTDMATFVEAVKLKASVVWSGVNSCGYRADW